MNILSTRNLAKSHGAKTLFSDLTTGVEDRDRVALIGVNGSGKSTLLRILAGAEQADSGDLLTRQDLRIEYLPQNPVFDESQAVIHHIFSSDKPEATLTRDYEEACQALEATPDDERLLNRFGELTRRMDAAAAWEYEMRTKKVLTRLAITDFHAPIGSLSGGYRKRLALAHAMLAEPDVLCMDEPTNHLDAETIDWLEDWVGRFPGAVILVTHDRYFLDRVATRIWEIDERRVIEYEGNFSTYLRRKAEAESAAAQTEERRQAILRKELKWLERGCRARTTKSKARKDKIDTLQEQAPTARGDSLTFKIKTRRLGGKIVEIEDLGHQWQGEPLFRNFSYTFTRGERMGIVGPNGCGKSTLANLIAGRLQPSAGTVEVGETVHFGYYDQESAGFLPSERAIDYVTRVGGEMLRGPDGSYLPAALMMEKFFFTSQMTHAPIEKLSGGERRRLYLVGVLMSDPNFLILDEPTNDLDVQTLQALEDFLDGFAGCLLVISHDRYFLDRTVDHVLAFEAGGQLRTWPGGYTWYSQLREAYQEEQKTADEDVRARSEQGRSNAAESKSDRSPRARKLTFNEKRELEQLEARIPDIEKRLKELDGEMAAAAVDYGLLTTLVAERDALNSELASAMDRWEHLAIIAEG